MLGCVDVTGGLGHTAAGKSCHQGPGSLLCEQTSPTGIHFLDGLLQRGVAFRCLGDKVSSSPGWSYVVQKDLELQLLLLYFPEAEVTGQAHAYMATL